MTRQLDELQAAIREALGADDPAVQQLGAAIAADMAVAAPLAAIGNRRGVEQMQQVEAQLGQLAVAARSRVRMAVVDWLSRVIRTTVLGS